MPLRRPEDPERATFLDLFFDLVFVFALLQLSHELQDHLHWRGAVETLVLLVAMWTVWNTTAGATDRFDPRHPAIQWLVVGCMFGSFVMAAAVSEAFDRGGLVFAGAYVASTVSRALTLVVRTRGTELQRPELRLLFWLGISAVPWLAGGVAHGWARAALWALALGVFYAAIELRFPAPRLGRQSWTEFALTGEYLADRYRQLFIIALGELILTSGLAFTSGGFETARLAPVVVAFTTTVLLWRIYIFRAGEVLGWAVTAAPDPYRTGALATYAHVLMIASIVPISVGDELVILHPSGHTPPAWIAVILGGPALFLVGRALNEYSVFARVSQSRVIGIIVLAAIAPAMIPAPPLVVALVATLVLAGIAVTDSARARRHPDEPPSPPAGPRS